MRMLLARFCLSSPPYLPPTALRRLVTRSRERWKLGDTKCDEPCFSLHSSRT